MNTPFEQLNDADLELVSAYIDGEVTADERAALEVRMEREPALRAALEELQATVQLVHELPRMTPPRSFTIDPARARPRRAGAFVWLRFGSALAAVLLALTVTFDLVGSRGSGMATSSAPQAAVMNDQPTGGAASAAPSVENAESAASGAANTNSAAASQLAPTSAPASGASGATAATPPDRQAPPSIMMQSAPAEQATAVVQSTEGGPSNTLTLRSAAPQTEQAPADAQTQSAPAPTTAAAGVAASGNSVPGAQTFEQPAAQPIPPQEPFRPLRLIEFGLAALALALGLAALWVARRGRG